MKHEIKKELRKQEKINYKLIKEIANECNRENIENLLKNGAEINGFDKNGDTSLIIALQKNPIDIELIDFLLNQDDIDVNSSGDSAKYKTPLMYAASLKPESDAMKICKMFMQKDCNVSLTSNADSEEWTAIDYAKSVGNNEVADYLIGNVE